MTYLNPIYNISQFIQLTKYFSHPSIYPQLHNKNISFNYILSNSNNQFYTKHHININSLLQTQPINNNNFSPPPSNIIINPQQPNNIPQPNIITQPQNLTTPTTTPTTTTPTPPTTPLPLL